MSIYYPNCPQQFRQFFKPEGIPPNPRRMIVPNATKFVSGLSSPSEVAGHWFILTNALNMRAEIGMMMLLVESRRDIG